MKQLFFAALALTCFISCDVKRKDRIADDVNIDSTKKANATSQPTTVQLIDSIFDFGTITQDEKVAYSFRFKNTGNSPLIIFDASASCGCTVPEKPEKPIMPGETGFIKVVFNSSGKSGHQVKDVTVHANTDPPFPPLKLTGEIKAKQ